MQITAPFFFFSILGIRKEREEKWRRSTAVAETIKPSSMRKHLAAGFILVRVGGGGGGGGGGVVFGKAATSTRLSEWMCNYTEHPFRMSDHLGVDGSYKSEHTPPPPPRVSWCYCMCFTSRCVWNTRREGEVRGLWGGAQRGREREDSGFCCLRAGGHLPFMPSLKQHQGISRALALALREPPLRPPLRPNPKPSSATLDKYPRLSRIHNLILFLNRVNFLQSAAPLRRHKNLESAREMKPAPSWNAPLEMKYS